MHSRSGKCARLAAMRTIVAFAVVLVVTGCGGPDRPALSPIAASRATPLPALSYRLLSGQPWVSQAALGHVIVLDIWATYCVPCRKSFPKLGQLAAAHPDAVVIGISVDDNDAAVDRFLREVPARFPIARASEQSVQSGPLAIRALPTVLVIDRRGRVRLRVDQMPEADYDALAGVVDALRAE
jgi:cytochrome c biogenesis protein CcmG, thiol:disulfide interchange protein DsbE